LFPGQGSQAIGMARHSVQSSSSAAEFFDAASDALGIDLRTLCWSTPLEKLTDTENAQPAIAAASIADWLAAREMNAIEKGNPCDACAGHSSGAVAAAVAAGFLSPLHGVQLAAARGRLMAQAPEGGSMLAATYSGVISRGTELRKWALECAQEYDVDVAAINSPRQIVFSGGKKELQDLAARTGLVSKMLTVSNAFHSRFMSPVASKWHDSVSEMNIQEGLCQYVCCTTGEITSDPEAVRQDLIDGMTKPVNWLGVMEATTSFGTVCVFGPGKAIARLARPFLAERMLQMYGERMVSHAKSAQ